MHTYLVSSATERFLSKDAVSYTESFHDAMRFYSWEDAYAYNQEYFNGELNEVDGEDL